MSTICTDKFKACKGYPMKGKELDCHEILAIIEERDVLLLKFKVDKKTASWEDVKKAAEPHANEIDNSTPTCESIYFGYDDSALEFDQTGIIAINGNIISHRNHAQLIEIIHALFGGAND